MYRKIEFVGDAIIIELVVGKKASNDEGIFGFHWVFDENNNVHRNQHKKASAF